MAEIKFHGGEDSFATVIGKMSTIYVNDTSAGYGVGIKDHDSSATAGCLQIEYMALLDNYSAAVHTAEAISDMFTEDELREQARLMNEF